jgi:hypothetical protein
MSAMMRRVRGVIGLVLLLALAVGLPWALASTIGNPLDQWSSIKAGDMSDQDVIAIMAAIAYLAWASFALALMVELGATLTAAVTRRARREFRLPLLGLQQDLARTLITAVLLLAPAVISVVGPATSAFASSPPLAATSTYTAPTHQVSSLATSSSTGTDDTWPVVPASAGQRQLTSQVTTSRYVIPQQGGMRSYWALAEHYLGDGQRWPEIWKLNEGHTQSDGSVMESPNLLRRGWTVIVPAAEPTSLAAAQNVGHEVTVHAGDTLSGLAEQDGVTDWSTVWPANEDRAEPGGAHFTDPNLIRPGWTISLPGPATAASPGSTTAPQQPTTPAQPPTRTTPTPQNPTPPTTPQQPSTPAQPATPAPTPAASPAPSARPAHSASHSSSSEVLTVAEWAASLSAGAGLLASGLFLALRRYRRRQFRYRGAGRAIAGPAPKHVPLEKVLITDGSAGVRDVDFIDRALRGLSSSLAAAAGRLPAVIAARLTEQTLDLVLAEPQIEAPPPPWVTASPTSWVIEKSAQLPIVDAYGEIPAAPYPTLVSVGYTAAGEEWLVDLEQSGALLVDGDRERSLDLTRFVAAELAHNVWSDHLTVTLAGQLGADLVELNPSRLIYTDDIPAAAAIAANDVRANRDVADGEQVDVLHGRLHGVSGDTWMPQVLLLSPAPSDSTGFDPADDAAIEALLDTLDARSSRTAVAVVLLPHAGSAPASTGLQLHVDAAGTLTIPALSVTATAQQLPADQAFELGMYLAAVRDSAADAPMPAAEAEDGSASYTDLAGAVLPEHTVPRPEQPAAPRPVVTVPSPTGLPALAPEPVTAAASLLPKLTSSYVVTTAATPAEIETLAPVLKPEISEALLAADPHLDEDLTAWHDRASDRPKVRLLGEVQVSAAGQPPDAKVAIATAAVAYLALHSSGVTGDRFAADFWPSNNYTIKDSNPKNLLSIVRSWLGVNPLTGSQCLPYAKSAGRASGSALYRLSGPLVDWDLFCRLRRRAAAREAEGFADLVAALDLVSGAPLTALRGGDSPWLADDTVADSNVMTAAILDVTTIVVARAVDEADLGLARRIAEKAAAIDSGSDRPLLDLALVCEAEGRTAELGATMRRIVTHHGAAVEEDVPKDTYEVMLRRGWVGLTQAS